jgi:hypothetical protein
MVTSVILKARAVSTANVSQGVPATGKFVHQCSLIATSQNFGARKYVAKSPRLVEVKFIRRTHGSHARQLNNARRRKS